MKKAAILVGIAALWLCSAVILMAQDKPAAAAEGWTVAQKVEVTGTALPKGWSVMGGDVEVKDGAIIMKGGEGECSILLSNPKMPASVKVEFDGTLTGDEICDMTAFLNAGEDGFASGYLVQFAGDANKQNRLRKEGEIVESTVCDKPMAKAGQKAHVVAANDGGVISLTVDGKKVFEYKDPKPLSGDAHALVGFYTYGCTLKLENIVVSKKDAPAAPAAK